MRRNRAIYSEYLDTIMVDHWTMAPVLASFKRRFGRLNDVVNGAMSRSVHVSRRLADLVRWTRSRLLKAVPLCRADDGMSALTPSTEWGPAGKAAP